MAEVKIYSKAWVKQIVQEAKDDERPSCDVFLDLIAKLNGYIAHLDLIDSRRGGKGTASERKIAANRINALKGGWKKGVPRKKKEAE